MDSRFFIYWLLEVVVAETGMLVLRSGDCYLVSLLSIRATMMITITATTATTNIATSVLTPLSLGFV